MTDYRSDRHFIEQVRPHAWDALTFLKYDAAWVLNFWLLAQEGGTTPGSPGAFLFLELPSELYVAPKCHRSKVRVSRTAADKKRRLNDVDLLCMIYKWKGKTENEGGGADWKKYPLMSNIRIIFRSLSVLSPVKNNNKLYMSP